MTKRPEVFKHDTRLWHPAEGWKVFPNGETDPGPAWHDVEGGRPVVQATEVGALQDLVKAHDEIAQLGRQLAQNEHDRAVIAKEASDALAQVADLKQRALDAERLRDEAQAVAREVTAERDRLLALVKEPGPPVADKRTIETAQERAGVEVPANWETLPFLSKKSLAAKLTDQPVTNKAEVEGAIRAHLASLPGV